MKFPGGAAAVAIAAMLLVACGSSTKNSSDDDDGGSGGAGAAGGAGATGGSAAAGGAAPGTACADYLACVAAAEPQALQNAIDTYGEDGSCWMALSDAECLNACQVATGQFAQTYPAVEECGGMVGSTFTPGLHYLAVSASLGPGQPFVVAATISVEGTSVWLDLQPLSAADRMTPVGSPSQKGPYEESAPIWDLGTMAFPAEANPITASAFEVENLKLQYQEPAACGTVDGTIVVPVETPLTGSTFTLVPIANLADAPAPPTIDCQGNLADGL